MWFLAVCACPLVSGRGSPASLRVPHRLATSALAHNARLVHATIRYGVDRHRCAVTSPEAKVLACVQLASGAFDSSSKPRASSHLTHEADVDVILSGAIRTSSSRSPTASMRQTSRPHHAATTTATADAGKLSHSRGGYSARRHEECHTQPIHRTSQALRRVCGHAHSTVRSGLVNGRRRLW